MTTTRWIASATRAVCGGTLARCAKRSRRSSAPSAEAACTVATPPGCPVAQASSRSSASTPRTSPTMMRFGQIERLHAADLTDDDAVRARPEGALHQVRECDVAVGPECEMVARRALQLDRVFEHDEALAGEAVGDLPQHGVRKRRLAGVRPAGD